MIVLKAEELKVGCQIEDADGVLFDVKEIVRETANTITVRICSDESLYDDYHTKKRDGTDGGVIRTYYKASLLIGNLPDLQKSVKEQKRTDDALIEMLRKFSRNHGMEFGIPDEFQEELPEERVIVDYEGSGTYGTK